MIMDVLLRRKLKEIGMTDFQISVLDATSNIPAGQVRTYKEIAIEIGHPNACRDDGIGMTASGKHVSVFIAAVPFGAYFGSGVDKGIKCKVSSWRRINSDILPVRAKS